MKAKYVVAVHDSEYDETRAFLFETLDEARDYLQKLWEAEYNNVLAMMNEDIDEDYNYHEDDFAMVSYDDDFKRFYISKIEDSKEYLKELTT